MHKYNDWILITSLHYIDDTKDVTVSSACKALLSGEAFKLPLDVSAFGIETTKK